jgi:hypothetical protein
VNTAPKRTLDDVIADSRVQSDTWSTYERGALLGLASLGFQSADLRDVCSHAFATDADRWHAWCYESIVWTIGEIRAGRNRDAFRGVLQASQYCGRIGWPNARQSEALGALRAHFERVLA